MRVIDHKPEPTPPVPYEEPPPCVAPLSPPTLKSNRYWLKNGNVGGQNFQLRKKRGLSQDLCGMNSRYLIDNQWYCRKHAAFYVLDRIAEKAK